jgi:drug/metabolite transporter (DMT)-like permease
MPSSSFALFLKSKTPQIALIIMTMIWGGTFVVVHYALNYSSPMFFVGCRFAAAAIAVGLLSYKYLKGINLKEICAGALIGSMIAGGYGSQTVGMQTISSSESAFLTALYVPLVPILIWLIFRKKPHIMTWLGVLLAFIGLIFLTGNGFNQINLNRGQIVTILGSFAIAMEIILIGHFAGKVNLQRVTVVQLAFASLISFAVMPFVGEHHIPAFSWELFILAVGLGLTSSILQLTMNWAQRSVDPSQAAVIYAGEPVWAALLGRIAGERLPILALFGGLLVVLGVVLSEWRPKFLQKRSHHKNPEAIEKQRS